MARKDALLKLHHRLTEQRDELRRKLTHQMESVGEQRGPGDLGDQSTIDADQELGSQLAALESRELSRIENALEAIRSGTYGKCEHCEKPIPITRLKALPHTSCCIQCQREYEMVGGSEKEVDNWESAWEHLARENDRELTVRDVKMDAR
ncbi:TraR/DksA family transcriptional regulator [Thalassoglobus polymorphus]|uniref:General stress protein 16O n=1 Tax=Thalassoglobus polymorphus TaxID=2527994 RepID=A0A517QL45_9PLAN|nr:TraR/DksA C4-type zinc finger protein [Thalassoglobus polymorphus]QDT32358.1 General stress protein 16O [Thalassoglobus polymorphus]